jgi:hypothetical protein
MVSCNSALKTLDLYGQKENRKVMNLASTYSAADDELLNTLIDEISSSDWKKPK